MQGAPGDRGIKVCDLRVEFGIFVKCYLILYKTSFSKIGGKLLTTSLEFPHNFFSSKSPFVQHCLKANLNRLRLVRIVVIICMCQTVALLF